MKKSIFFKIFASYFIVALCLLLITILLFFGSMNDYYNRMIEDYLKKNAYLIYDRIEADLMSGQWQRISNTFRGFEEDRLLKVFLLNDVGGALYQPVSVSSPLFTLPTNTGHTVLTDMYRMKTVPHLNVNLNSFYYTLPIDISNKLQYSLWVGIASERSAEFGTNFILQIVFIGIVLLVISIISSLFFSRRISYPIDSLVSVSREIQKGNYAVSIHLPAEVEFRVVAESINKMTQQVRTLTEELNTERSELNTVMNSMRESLWIVDEKDRVVYGNRSFRELVKQNDVELKPYWELIRETRVDEMIDTMRASGGSLIEEFQYHGGYYLFSGEWIEYKKQILIILSDLSQIKEAEILKKNLIDNVSHELKTPLTSIQGFVETLKSMETDSEKMRIMDIIARNTTRLNSIIADLMSLSRLETGTEELDLEDVRLNELVHRVMPIFDKPLLQKGLKMNLDESETISIKADAYYLEKIFVNLIDNAIKYTDKGEIAVRLSKIDKWVKIEVEDTGIGISESQLGKIFDRFYVVDKSRSRKSGGTGLGLSIVRQIVMMHNGSIDVESVVGQGTKFVVRLPIL